MDLEKDKETRQVRVRLRTRASRTREKSEEIVSVEAPRSEQGQINQLSALVAERFPGATLRVFHDGAGSFTRDDLHVVAAYQDEIPVAPEVTKDPSTEPEYRQLPLSA
jgi:hypothetical protein